MGKLFRSRDMRLNLTFTQNNKNEPSAFFKRKEGADGFFVFYYFVFGKLILKVK